MAKVTQNLTLKKSKMSSNLDVGCNRAAFHASNSF